MPLITSTFRPPLLYRNPQFQTIYPSLFRKVEGVSGRKERLDTPDGDFLDLSWSEVGGEQLVVILHGLEGSADRGYALGIAQAFNRRGWDAVGLNFRSCSGEPNRLARSYHSGETGDLEFVLQQVLERDRYRSIALVGYSLGGNVLLKYLGEKGENLPRKIQGGAALSVPCDLAGASRNLEKGFNKVYTQYFLRKLRKKVLEKSALISHAAEVSTLKTIWEFDDRYTAPIHGFRDAADYYQKSHCKQFLQGITRPTLLITAQDDPFLSRSCLPFEEAEKNRNFFFEAPRYGGHVGFYTGSLQEEFWHETRVVEFVTEKMV